MVEAICHDEEIGAGGGFLKQSVLNLPQMLWPALSGTARVGKAKTNGPLTKI